jgi:DNA-binding CsgD family transcriptional regulator/PAS domain-containing protein
MPWQPGEGAVKRTKSAPRTGSLISDVYEAALKPSHWAAVLARLVAQFKGSGAALRTFEATPEKGGFWCTYGIEPSGLEQFEQYFSTRNIWQARAEALGLYKTGTVMTSDTLVQQRELRASEFYRSFLRHHDIQDLLALVLHDGLTPPMPRTVVSIFRSHRQARFGKADIEAAREYVPHLARAVEMNFRFADLRRREAISGVALARFAPALAYFRRDGTLVSANRAAETLFGARDGLMLAGARLIATGPRDNELLQRALAAGGADPLRIDRPSAKMPYVAVAVVLPVDPVDPPDARQPHVALLLYDPEATSELELSVLARLYRLTPSELRIVQALVAHGSAKAICQNTKMNRNTVRSQLNSVLKKTGTNAQAELVRLALTVAGVKAV